MNKTNIKNFAIWARRKLISEITYKAGIIGINDKAILKPLPISTGNIQFFDIGTSKPTEITSEEIKQRNGLINRIKEKESTSDYPTAFQFVIEEVAYTWFNRLIAIRFMEVNDYLPSRIRVLSSEIEGKAEPDMVTTPFDTDMEFSSYETDRIMQLKDENKLDELFRMLFIKQCNKLNDALPELFEKTADYTEFLLNISFADKDGIVSHLVNDIEEEDFTEAVEIIGWLYQYYNTEPKDEVFALLKKNVKITKERIPAATQLFTPDWIVRYMVENSLGRLWVEGHPNENLKPKWKYYLEEAEQEPEVKVDLEKIRNEYSKLNPEDIKIIDPCMGSGHILVYAFDVLMQIYESQGYTQRDAAQAIIDNNLFGLDIDDRAYQLAYFAIMMKGRKYDRRFLTRGLTPKLYSIKESNDIDNAHLRFFGHSLNEMERNIATQQMEYLLKALKDAKEYGSILNIDDCNWELLNCYIDDFNIEGQISIERIGAERAQGKLKELITISSIMSRKYHVVVTNPPYMGSGGMGSKLSNYVKKHFPDSKSDFSSIFIETCRDYTKNTGYFAMITQPSFLFLSSFKKLRSKIINQNTISSLLHMGRGIFGVDFGSTAFVLNKKHYNGYNGCYSKLHEKTFQYIDPDDISRLYLMSKGDTSIRYNFSKYNTKNQISIENEVQAIGGDKGTQLYYETNQKTFLKIPDSPIAYWINSNIVSIFDNKLLGEIASPKQGLATTDNNRFVRFWAEVDFSSIGFNMDRTSAENSGLKWFPFNKGGEYRKWYGNNDCIANYQNDGAEIKENVLRKYTYLKTPDFVVKNQKFYFEENGTWSAISSGNVSVRYSPKGFIISNAGMGIYSDSLLKYIIAFMNSKCVSSTLLGIINQTLNFNAGDIEKIPFILSSKDKVKIDSLSNNCIEISKTDWDSFEHSWEFAYHPLVGKTFGSSNRSSLPTHIVQCFEEWEKYCEAQFNQLKNNEEELNYIFINIYGLQDELTPGVEDKDVTIHKADLQRDIKSLISYAVGCMFGRYSLDIKGLIYAGGEWNDNKFTTFVPDADNCIPITDEQYFEDDIVGLFVSFVKKVYGIETLEKNLDFIAKALKNKGDTSREIIRNYFIKDFYKDHVKIYNKRPIYWLYDSGRQNGFKALIYMHRYNADTTGIVRVDYLHEMQKIYAGEIDRMQDMAENSTQAREIAQAEKRKEKLVKQLKETKEYDEKIAHIALSRIDIDLDDGVKVNYEKVQTGQDGKKLAILAKI